MWADMKTSHAGLAYLRRGAEATAGPAPTVLLLHGIPGSGAVWRPVLDHLSRDFPVVVPDLLGFGGSERPDRLEELHAASQAAAVGRLLDELGIGPVVVIGHDFGGPVALALFGQRPEQVCGLGLLATNAFTDTPIPFPLNTVTWPAVGRISAAVLFSRPSLSMMLRVGVGRPRRRLASAEYLGDRSQQRAIRTIFHGSLARLVELYQPIQDQLDRVEVPTLVGWGDRDPFFPVAQGERTAASVRTSLRAYPDAGHFLPEERPVDVALDIDRLVAASGLG